MKKFPLIALIVLIALAIRLQNAHLVFGYMLPHEYDPFYHLRLAEVILNSGYRPDFDFYLNYPYGFRIDWLPLFDYILAFPGILLGYNAMLLFSFYLSSNPRCNLYYSALPDRKKVIRRRSCADVCSNICGLPDSC